MLPDKLHIPKSSELAKANPTTAIGRVNNPSIHEQEQASKFGFQNSMNAKLPYVFL